MTQPVLLALGAFATLATIGMFFEYGDDWTQSLVGMVASVTWSLVSLSSFNVFIPTDGTAYEIALTPLVWFAAGLALTTFLFTLLGLMQGIRREAESTDVDAFR